MNALQLSPVLFPGVQVSTLTNSALGTEFKKVQIFGTSQNEDAYVDVYLNYVSDATKIRVVAGQSIAENQLFEANLPQAATYIIKSADFSGVLIADLGPGPTISSESESGSAATSSPAYAFKTAILPDSYTDTQISDWIAFGPVPGFLKTVLFTGEITASGGGSMSVVISEADDASGTNEQIVTVFESPDSDGSLENLEQGFDGCAWGSFKLTKPYVNVTLAADPTIEFNGSVVFFEQPIV